MWRESNIIIRCSRNFSGAIASRVRDAEGFGLQLAVALHQSVHPLLGGPQRTLTLSRQVHASLEDTKRFLKRQIATLETLDDAFELPERLFKIEGLLIGWHARISLSVTDRGRESAPKGATLYIPPRDGQLGSISVDVPEGSAVEFRIGLEPV